MAGPARTRAARGSVNRSAAATRACAECRAGVRTAASRCGRRPPPTGPAAPAEPAPPSSNTTSLARAPAPATAPDRPRLAAGEIAALLARGDSLLGAGDIVSARLFYERASDAGGGRAALRLGATYDPGFLDQVQLPHLNADVARALSWYRRALDLGESEAARWIRRWRQIGRWGR